MAVISWNVKLTNGNGAKGDFGTGGNWLGGAVPDSSDDASITLPGGYTVTSSFAGTVTINGLQLSSGATLSIAGVGEIFNIRNGSDTRIGGEVNGNVVVGLGDILNVTGNWSGKKTGKGRVYAYGTVNMGQLRGRVLTGIKIADGFGIFSATSTNALDEGILNFYGDTISLGLGPYFGGQIRAGSGGFGGTTNIYGGSIRYGTVDSRAYDGGGTINLDDVTLTDVMLDTTNSGSGGNVIQTISTPGTISGLNDVAGTVLIGIQNADIPNGQNGLINIASLQVQDGTNLTLEGYIDNSNYTEPARVPRADYAGDGIFLDGVAHDTVLWVHGNTTLAGGGSVVMGANPILRIDSSNNIIDAAPGTTSILTTDNFIFGAGDIGTDGAHNSHLGLINTGTIEATSALHALTVDIGFNHVLGSMNNTGGKLESAGGGITGGGVLSGGTLSGGLLVEDTNIGMSGRAGSGGELVVASNSYAASGNTYNASMLFDNTNGNNTGLWIIGAGRHLTGTTISGFAGSGASSSDELDFAGLAFGKNSAATWTQGGNDSGTLAVKSGNGAVTLDLTLIGTYAAGTSDFQVQADKAANTVVTTSNASNALHFGL
jgi:hypothetical protein